MDYDEGRISTPDGQTIKMKMIDSVWTVPVRPSDINVTVRVFHTVPGPNTLVVTSQSNPQYIKYHESLFLPGVTMWQHIETHPSISMVLGTSKYVRRRQIKCKKDRSENPNKVQDPSGKALQIPTTSAQVPNGQETSISATSDDSAPCPETLEKGEDRTKIPSNQTSENKKTQNDVARGLSNATDDTSLDISDQGERNDTGEKPRVLLNKNFSEETVALVIMDGYIYLTRVIPCKKRGNVLPHILDTLRVQAYRHRMKGQIENFILHLKGKIRIIQFLKGIPDRF